MILIDFVFRTGNNYHYKFFLEKCKYVVKEKKMSKYIIDDIVTQIEKILTKKIVMKNSYTRQILIYLK